MQKARFSPTVSTLLVLAALVAVAPVAAADDAPPPAAAAASATASSPKAARQGVAVIGLAGARDEAFQLARAVYASSARPNQLDEVRARILAGDPPGSAGKDLRDLAELRSGITGEDAASRQLLATLADRLGVQALLVVQKVTPPAPVEAPAQAPAADADAGAPAAAEAPAPAPTRLVITPPAVARLFLAETGDFDAANYSPESTDAGGWSWQGTVRSVAGRFPPAFTPPPRAAARPKSPKDMQDSRPFYAKPWLWAALGAAALAGLGIWFSTRDSSSDPIHLQMRAP